MKKELDDALCAKFPKIFAQRSGNMRDTAMCWGFECGDGWYSLLDSLCGFLQWNTDMNGYPQVVATQVKEKFGTLRFYVNMEGGKEGRDSKYLDGAIDFAELLSSTTCEVCGAPGEANDSGWVRVRCEAHKEI